MSSAASATKRYLIASVPKGEPSADTFKLEDTNLPAEVPEGQVRVRAVYVSVDPYLRGLIGRIGAGKPIVSGQVAEVVASKAAEYKQGDKVFFYGQWATEQIVDPKSADAKLKKIDPSLPPSAYLGVAGMPGATAYFGLHEVAQFKKGDIVLVSGAAGAVGSLVGQLAKRGGAKLVVGTAGGPEKCKRLVEHFGFDAAIDYKKFDTEEKVTEELKRLSPDGFDVYFDNTGGHVTDALLNVVRKFARLAICGSISVYNKDPREVKVPSPYPKVIYSSTTIRGFLVFDYAAKWDEFEKNVHPLVRDGKLKFDETVVEGFDKIPEAFAGLFHGKNTGKMVVKVA